jgi:hypothetical protein
VWSAALAPHGLAEAPVRNGGHGAGALDTAPVALPFSRMPPTVTADPVLQRQANRRTMVARPMLVSPVRTSPADRRPAPGVLYGEWDPSPIDLDSPRIPAVAPVLAGAWLARGVLTADDCARLVAAMEASGRALPVSVHGLPGGGAEVGSVRATAWAPTLGCALWQRLASLLPAERRVEATTPTDWHWPTPHRRWRPVGVSPLLRFMRYDAGGRHHGHYDRSFDHGDGRRTLMSLVLYLTEVAAGWGGRTRFLRDGQEHLPVELRRHDDWPREARGHEVLAAVRPERGAVLLFDHRMCHDIERYDGPVPRVIVRGDVVFEALD